MPHASGVSQELIFQKLSEAAGMAIPQISVSPRVKSLPCFRAANLVVMFLKTLFRCACVCVGGGGGGGYFFIPLVTHI